MIEDFSLGLMSLDEQSNLNGKEECGNPFSDREKRETKRRLKMNNYL